MFQDKSTGPRPVCLILIEDFCPKFLWIWNSGSGGNFYFKLCRPFCSVMGKSLWNFETVLSPPVLFFLTIQGSTSFVDLGCLSFTYCRACVLQFCGDLMGKGWSLASHMCDVFLFLSLSHLMSWFRCGTWLYRFLIFAFFTLVEGIIRNIFWNYFYYIGIILNFHTSDLETFLEWTFMTRFVQSSLSSFVLIFI